VHEATAKAAAAAAAAALAAAQAAANEGAHLRGRLGQVQSRIDTLWQVQESDQQVKAAVERLENDSKEAASGIGRLKAAIIDAKSEVEAVAADCSRARNQQDAFERRFGALESRVAVDEDAAASAAIAADQWRQDVAATTERLAAQMQEQLQQVAAALETQRTATKAFAAHCEKAHERCEELRRGSALLVMRMDSSVAPLKERMERQSSR